VPDFFVDHGDQGTPRAFTGALIIPPLLTLFTVPETAKLKMPE